jgi:hypothetical protein
MAKQIIILERPDVNRFTACFWLAVPVARQPIYVNAGATSSYKQASAGEITALQSGAVVEQTADMVFLATTTLAQIKTALIAEHAQRQAALDAANPWDRYGTFYDGTSWTTGGVA